jgi:hypothetical protein
MTRVQCYHGRHGQGLSVDDVVKESDFLVGPDGLYPCTGLDGHRLTSHEAGVVIMRPCDAPQSPEPFIPQKA